LSNKKGRRNFQLAPKWPFLRFF